jgi:hypothetical protein
MALMMLFVACNRGEQEGTSAEERRRKEPQPLVRRDCAGGSAQTVDVNNDGRADIIHRAEDGRRRCSEVDMNFDGNPDLLRFYADDGRTVALEQHDFDFDGRIDEQAYYNKANAIERKELDTNFDGLIDSWLWCKGPLIERAERARRKPGRIDTWERYQHGALAEVQYDENNDGVVEKWDVYTQGALAETRVDTNADGKPDRVDTAEGGGNTDERVSCDGTTLPPEIPAPALFGDGGIVATIPGSYDGGVPLGTVHGLSGAAIDAGLRPLTDAGTKGEGKR